jgi:hypothetical protein
MSYVDTMTEADEFRAMEEGIIQGLKIALSIADEHHNTYGYTAKIVIGIREALSKQIECVEEIYGDDESE